MSLTLTREELSELTGYSRRAEQARILAQHGIPFREVNARIVVLREHVKAWMEGRPVRAHVEPNWGAIK